MLLIRKGGDAINQRVSCAVSDVGILAALMNGYSPDEVAVSLNESLTMVRQVASGVLADVLRELGLTTQFKIELGGIPSNFVIFANWIERKRNFAWTAVLNQREQHEVDETLCYMTTISKNNFFTSHKEPKLCLIK